MDERELEKVFKALGNRRRIRILRILKRRPSTVGDIAGELKLSFMSTSKHLAVLYSVGFLDKEQKGKEIFYKLEHGKIKSFTNQII